jgi:hypothetical protein
MAAMLCHEADLALRAPEQFVRPRVSWPCVGSDDNPIAVFLSEPGSGPELTDALCTEAGFVVLAVSTAEQDLATITLEWAADHGRQLGGDPDHLVVAGGRIAAETALHASREGWPALTRVALIGSGLARYARRLREAGVEVDQIGSDTAMSSEWMRGLRE